MSLESEELIRLARKNSRKDSKQVCKSTANYRKSGGDVTIKGDSLCRDCMYFRHPFMENGAEPRGPGACSKVRGIIHTNFVCDFWADGNR